MRAAHTVMSVSRNGGGLYGAVLQLGQALHAGQGVDVEVLSLRDEHSERDLPSWRPLRPAALATHGPRAFGYAPGMLPNLIELRPDLVHCHGLWLYPSLACTRWARRTNKPYLISPHGMLEPRVELAKSVLKKRVALGLYQGRHLRRAHCIHALCCAEAGEVRQFGLKNPVAIVPNGVHLPDERPGGVAAPWADAIEGGRKVLLYVGRINPKKGIAHLVRAFAAVKRDDPGKVRNWCLAVVGWDQGGHTAELAALVQELGLGAEIKLLGPLFGDGKDAALRNASAFALPSESEGLPLTVMEGWSYRLPVLMTPQCNIPEGFEAGAAIRSEPQAQSLALALHELFGMTDAQRRDMGGRGYQLVRDKFSWPHVAARMRSVYDWLAGGGSPPADVEVL